MPRAAGRHGEIGLSADGLWRVVRFGAAGAASLLVDVALQWLLRVGLGLPVWLAPALSYELGLLAHFFLLTVWVFRQVATWGRLVKFHVTAAGAAAITLGVTYGLLTQPVVPYFADPQGPFGAYGPEAAKLVGTATAMGWTLVSSFFWVWRPTTEHPRSEQPSTCAARAQSVRGRGVGSAGR